MRRSHWVWPLILAAAGLLLYASSSFAQKTSGTITGVVTDSSGAVIPGATVTVTNQATAATRTTTTGTAGSYTFPELPAGTYNVVVRKSGFKLVTEQNVALHVASTSTINIQLPVGSASEQVNVEASPIMVQTQSGEVSNVMLGAQVRELPLNGRNFVQLTTLVPGAAVGENFDAKNKGLLAGVDISFSGAPSNANQWRVDGTNNNDIGSQRTILIYPSIDDIEEFKILRNSYGPEYGGAGGAQVNIVTKGGGNQFHGDAYYFGRNDALNAKNYFLGQQKGNCAPGQPNCGRKQMLRRNDWGYTFGGPIKQDKVFFFWSEEWNHERRGAVRQAWLPTAAERTGNFSDLAAANANAGGACAGPPVPNDPLTGLPFTNNLIVPSRISPAGQAYISQTPLPNISNLCAQYNWVDQVKIPLNWREENIRGDWNVTRSTTLMLRYAQDTWVNATHAYEEGGLWGDQNWPAVSDNWNQPGKMAIAKLTTAIGANTVNDFQFSWSGNRIYVSRGGDNPALGQSIVNQIGTVYPKSGKLHGTDLPMSECWCTGGNPLFGTLGPWQNRQDLFAWKDDFSRVVGKHTFKLGFLYDRNAKDEEGGSESPNFWGAAGYNGSLSGPGYGWSSPTGNNIWSDFLLKGTLWGFGENSRNIISPIRWRDTEFYFGDTWKMTRRFTFDYGFRWSFMPHEFLADNHYAAWEPWAYDPAKAGDPCDGIVYAKGAPDTCAALGFMSGTYSKYRSIVPSNHHLIAPRLGFAWDIFGTQRFVLRAGVGQFFARDPVGISIRTEQTNPPFTQNAGGEYTLDAPAGGYIPNSANLQDFTAGGIPANYESLETSTNLANSWQWNVTTETELWKDATLELGWVALRGIHLESSADLNEVPPWERLQYVLRPSGDNGNQYFPYGNIWGGAPGSIYQWNHRGDSIYHSLQAMFKTRFTHNSILQTSYTWSHNIANTTLNYVDTTSGIVDTYNPRQSRGNADFDRRHVFNTSLVYNLPTLEGHSGFLKSLMGGWETSTVLSFYSGPHLNIAGGLSNVGGVGGSDPWGLGHTGRTRGQAPLRVFGQPCFTGNKSQWVNPAAFSYNGYVLGQPPNSGVGQCVGPNTEDVDLAFDKNWSLPFRGGRFFGEQSRIQFRIEAFNLFNHPMFRFNGQNLTYTATGGSAVNSVIQGTSLVQGSTFGQTPLASTIGNREIQYALKFIF